MPQSDIELTISRFSRIEQRLVTDLGATERIGATRTSFINRLSEVEHLFTAVTSQRLRSIASLRNKLVHGDITSLPNREQFIKDCDMVDMAIDLAKEKVGSLAGGRTTVNSSARPVGDVRQMPLGGVRRTPNGGVRRMAFREGPSTPNAFKFFLAIMVLFVVFSLVIGRNSLASNQPNQDHAAVLDISDNKDRKVDIQQKRKAAQIGKKKEENKQPKVTKKEKKRKDLDQLKQGDAAIPDISDNNDQKEDVQKKAQAAQAEIRTGQSVQVEATNKGVSSDLFGEFVFCKVTFSNLTDRDIARMRGKLTVMDSEGKVLHAFVVYFNSKHDGKMKAKSSLVKIIGSGIGFNDDYSEFDAKDRLYRDTPLTSMKFSWSPEYIVYEDGTETAK